MGNEHYDEVTCDYPLPDRPAWAKVFQTKDLDCMMDHYHITDDGRLRHKRWDGKAWLDDGPCGVTCSLNLYGLQDNHSGRYEVVVLMDLGKVLLARLVEYRRGAETSTENDAEGRVNDGG